jgi:hypothetical protein
MLRATSGRLRKHLKIASAMGRSVAPATRKNNFVKFSKRGVPARGTSSVPLYHKHMKWHKHYQALLCTGHCTCCTVGRSLPRIFSVKKYDDSRVTYRNSAKGIEKYFKFYYVCICLKELKKGTKTPCVGSNNFAKYTKTQVCYSYATHFWHTPYNVESNPHPFYSFRGLKNQMRITIAVESWILEKW